MALPNFLYKYGSFKQTDGLSHLLDILEHHRLYFASPETFNDPFDMRPGVSVDVHSPGFREDYFKFLDDLLRDRGMYSHRRRQKIIQEQYSELIGGPTFQTMYHDYLVTKGICCLSENPNSLLMWAHYTDGHDGYCLQFNTQLWDPCEGNISTAEQVLYQSEYPQIDVWSLVKERTVSGKNPTEVHEAAGRLAVLRKSPEWSYEREWRIAATKPSFNTFAPRSLIGLVLGSNTSDPTRQRIVEVVSKLEHKPQVLKAVLDVQSYSLNYVPI